MSGGLEVVVFFVICYGLVQAIHYNVDNFMRKWKEHGHE